MIVTAAAVSYTHLDVYKRQAQRVVEADYKTMKRRVMEVLNQVGLGSKAKYYPCLLYTSRCV